jgi:hypothetical protein
MLDLNSTSSIWRQRARTFEPLWARRRGADAAASYAWRGPERRQTAARTHGAWRRCSTTIDYGHAAAGRRRPGRQPTSIAPRAASIDGQHPLQLVGRATAAPVMGTKAAAAARGGAWAPRSAACAACCAWATARARAASGSRVAVVPLPLQPTSSPACGDVAAGQAPGLRGAHRRVVRPQPTGSRWPRRRWSRVCAPTSRRKRSPLRQGVGPGDHPHADRQRAGQDRQRQHPRAGAARWRMLPPLVSALRRHPPGRPLAALLTPRAPCAGTRAKLTGPASPFWDRCGGRPAAGVAFAGPRARQPFRGDGPDH